MGLFQKVVFTLTAIILIGIIGFVLYAFEKRNPSELQLCGWGKTYPYYRASDYYQEDFFDFKEYIHENHQTVGEMAHKNAIIRLQFMINCEAEIGNFKVRSYDFNYNIIQVPEEISNHFIQLIKNYDKWNPPRNSKNERINIFKFYAFKLENGKIIEILPK